MGRVSGAYGGSRLVDIQTTDGTMTTNELIGVIAAVSTLIGGIFTGMAVLLKLWWDKGAKARVQIIKAQADAKAEENQRELEGAQEDITELRQEMAQLRDNHQSCVEEREECERQLARLRGYMDGRFDKVELEVTKIKEAFVTDVPAIPKDHSVIDPAITLPIEDKHLPPSE